MGQGRSLWNTGWVSVLLRCPVCRRRETMQTPGWFCRPRGSKLQLWLRRPWRCGLAVQHLIGNHHWKTISKGFFFLSEIVSLFSLCFKGVHWKAKITYDLDTHTMHSRELGYRKGSRNPWQLKATSTNHSRYFRAKDTFCSAYFSWTIILTVKTGDAEKPMLELESRIITKAGPLNSISEGGFLLMRPALDLVITCISHIVCLYLIFTHKTSSSAWICVFSPFSELWHHYCGQQRELLTAALPVSSTIRWASEQSSRQLLGTTRLPPRRAERWMPCQLYPKGKCSFKRMGSMASMWALTWFLPGASGKFSIS